MEVKSTKKIIVVRMLDWAIVALVILLFLVVLVGLTTNKAISFWGLQFNINNNYSANERNNFIDNPNPVAPANTSNSTVPTNNNTVAPVKAVTNNIGAANPSINNATAVTPNKENISVSSKQSSNEIIKPSKNDKESFSAPIRTEPSSGTVRKSSYAAVKSNENNYDAQSNQERSNETNYSNNSTNGNPYINNGSYRVAKENPRSNNSVGGARDFSQSEMNEFMRQFPNRKTDIHFVHFGYLDAEMEAVRAQILAALNKNGYTNIDANWNKYTDYTTINEVHFGVNGYAGANFYIPKAKN
jgi:hypothetical protein